MADARLTLTPEEQEFLSRHLESALQSERVEEHRTETRAFRQFVQHEIAIIERLLAKLKSAP